MSIDELIDELEERLVLADHEAAESHCAAMNSYGAGYDCGYRDALRSVLARAKGEEP